LVILKLVLFFVKLVEKLNVQFLKLQFNEQSEIIVNDYMVNLNSREISLGNIKLKLTEKEINTIIYLFKIKSPVTIDELQRKVWSYQSNIETHTVETHIYRLRKKMFKTFNDENFLISKKIIGIGESGLDFYYNHSDKDVQKKLFREHILASQVSSKPLIVHSRSAENEILEISLLSKFEETLMKCPSSSCTVWS